MGLTVPEPGLNRNHHDCVAAPACAGLCRAAACGIMTDMRYWWANQKHTYADEVAGGFLWSRKRRADGSRNPFYETVRLAEPGDLIFAYSDAHIKAIGVVLSHARTTTAQPSLPVAPDPMASAPRPAEGMPGWLLDVAWLELKRPLQPGRFMTILAPLLPEAYAPLTPGGKGIQGGRLLELPSNLARALLQLTGGSDPAQLVNPDWMPHQLKFVFEDTAAPVRHTTER
jgi:hypothetical protein